MGALKWGALECGALECEALDEAGKDQRTLKSVGESTSSFDIGKGLKAALTGYFFIRKKKGCDNQEIRHHCSQ